jgi:hypothetical protein
MKVALFAAFGTDYAPDCEITFMTGQKLTSLLFALSLLISPLADVFAQAFQASMTQAFESGNVREISRHFDKRVQVSIDRQASSYSTAQAEIIVRNFLDGLGKKDFRLLHSGTEEGGAVKLFIGEIRSAKGQYKTYIYMRKMGAQSFIQELRFEKF